MMNERTTEQAMREAFEADAVALGFDITREDMPWVTEPWSEYVDRETGHRWAGYLAAQDSTPQPQSVTVTDSSGRTDYEYVAGPDRKGGVAVFVKGHDYLKVIYDALIEPLSAAGIPFDMEAWKKELEAVKAMEKKLHVAMRIKPEDMNIPFSSQLSAAPITFTGRPANPTTTADSVAVHAAAITNKIVKVLEPYFIKWGMVSAIDARRQIAKSILAELYPAPPSALAIETAAKMQAAEVCRDSQGDRYGYVTNEGEQVLMDAEVDILATIPQDGRTALSDLMMKAVVEANEETAKGYRTEEELQAIVNSLIGEKHERKNEQ